MIFGILSLFKFSLINSLFSFVHWLGLIIAFHHLSMLLLLVFFFFFSKFAIALVICAYTSSNLCCYCCCWYRLIQEEIEIECKVLRVGKSVGVVSVEIRKKKTGKIIAQGRHTKYLLVRSKI